MKYIMAILLGVSFHSLSSAQIQNSGFETWDSTFACVYESELINTFQIPDPVSGVIHDWTYGTEYGIARTTDAYEGEYALIVHNWYGYARESVYYRDTISYRPQSLNGYYKYIGENNQGLTPFATGIVSILSASGDTLSKAVHYFDTTSVYTYFEMELLSVQNGTPDTLSIYFLNANQACGVNIVCNFFYLDQLSLSPDPSTSISQPGFSPIRFYPNPVEDVLYIETDQDKFHISITDMLGRILFNGSNIQQIDCKQLPAGMYILHLSSLQGHIFSTVKFCKQ